MLEEYADERGYRAMFWERGDLPVVRDLRRPEYLPRAAARPASTQRHVADTVRRMHAGMARRKCPL